MTWISVEAHDGFIKCHRAAQRRMRRWFGGRGSCQPVEGRLHGLQRLA
jgi:hypothetical protein